MKRFLAALVFASAAAFAISPVFAETDVQIEVSIEEDSDVINEEASLPDGEGAVVEKIRSEFDVEEGLISGLRAQKLGYGEISIALSLAERMPGGITDENIETILSMRQGSPVQGWGNIARELGLKLNPSAERLERISDEYDAAKDRLVRHEKTKVERTARAGRVEKAERPARVEKAERVERVERAVRIERPERPERGPKK